jgi:hypothetical protein
MAIGMVTQLANSWIFSNLWLALDWRRTIAEWLAGLGGPTIGGWFGVFWIRIPEFFVAAMLGVVIARLFAARWISAVCFSALGYVGTSFALTGWLIFCVLPAAPSWSGALKMEAWSMVSILLIWLAAWLCIPRHARVGGAFAAD